MTQTTPNRMIQKEREIPATGLGVLETADVQQMDSNVLVVVSQHFKEGAASGSPGVYVAASNTMSTITLTAAEARKLAAHLHNAADHAERARMN